MERWPITTEERAIQIRPFTKVSDSYNTNNSIVDILNKILSEGFAQDNLDPVFDDILQKCYFI